MNASPRAFRLLRVLCAMGAGLLLAGAVQAGEPRLKIGMVSDGGRFDDAGFNQSCKEGADRALREFSLFALFQKSLGPKDYERKLRSLAERDCDLIIGVGILIRDAVAKVAADYPHIKFVVVDGTDHRQLPNVRSLVFRVEECAFPAGFLAAAWADLKDPADPQVAYVGGMKVDSVENFTVPFAAGVAYYNKEYGKAVRCAGVYKKSFNSFSQGYRAGLKLAKAGADVIFGVGSKTGNGALAAALRTRRWGIGVDTDQYYSLQDEQAILLTSCIKRLDNAVYEVIRDTVRGTFEGGAKYTGNLANEGVGLAPFHDLEDQVPAPIRKDLERIQQSLRQGSLDTGWPAR